MSQSESLNQIEEKLDNLSLTAKNNIDNANTQEELDKLRVSLLGKKGDLSIILKTMGQLSSVDRPVVGQKANLIKINLQDKITCLLYTSPSPRDLSTSRMPSSA